ncbi:MAG: hypothetical protein KDD82_13690 [Planctomycetes bacterium]|nr:hypothetical protein [Planctomycetota bacterium]
MRVVFSEAQPRAPWLRFVLRNFVVYNPMFVFSALLALAGAFLINPPGADGGRDLLPTAQLFGVIQLYELALLGAAWLLRRRARGADPFAPQTRDVRFLVLVSAPFLLDVTFTTSSLGVSLLNEFGQRAALGFGAALVVCALLKVQLAIHLVGVRFSLLERAALVLGPAAATCTPLIGGALAQEGNVLWVAPVLGAVIAALVAVFGALAGGEGSAWVMRRLAPLALIATAVHACSTVYAYDGPLLQTLGLGVIALGYALPRLAPLGAWAAPARVVLPWVGAFACGLPVGADRGALGWTAGLACALAVHAGLFARTRELRYLAGALAAIYLGSAGTTLPGSFQAVGTRAIEPALLLGLVALGGWRGVAAGRLAGPLLLAALLAARLELLGGTALDVALGWNVLGLGVLAWALRDFGRGPQGAFVRASGILLCVIPSGVAVLCDAPGALAWTGALIAILAAAAALTRLPAFAFPVLLLPVELASEHAPTSAAAWGALGLAAAFCGLAAGVAISLNRERALAWLDASEDPDHAKRSVIASEGSSAAVAPG